jgi:hypothetical protein
MAMRPEGVSSLSFVGAWLIPSLAAIPLAAALWLTIVFLPVPALVLAAGAGVGLLTYVAPLARWWLKQLRSISRTSETISPDEQTAPCRAAILTTQNKHSNIGGGQ